MKYLQVNNSVQRWQRLCRHNCVRQSNPFCPWETHNLPPSLCLFNFLNVPAIRSSYRMHLKGNILLLGIFESCFLSWNKICNCISAWILCFTREFDFFVLNVIVYTIFIFEYYIFSFGELHIKTLITAWISYDLLFIYSNLCVFHVCFACRFLNHAHK